jgi:hypothetical protein
VRRPSRGCRRSRWRRRFHLERRDGGHEPAEVAAQQRPDLKPQRSLRSCGGAGGVPDGVDDRGGGEQPGNDGDTDGPADADRGDQTQREQRSEHGAEVVHHPLEAVGAPVSRWAHDIGQ